MKLDRVTRAVCLSLVVTLAWATSGASVLACGEGRHQMPCCESEARCPTAAFTQSCCGPQPLVPSVPTPASVAPETHAASHPALPAALVAKTPAGPLTPEARLAFEHGLLKLVHDPPYLRNGSLLI